MSGQTGTVRATPKAYGAYNIYARAKDSVGTGRISEEASERFYVAVPKEAGLWDMNLVVQSGVGRIAPDSNPSGTTKNPLSLHGWATTWSEDGPGRAGKMPPPAGEVQERMDTSLTFSGVEHAQTAAKVLTTASSFSVSAWVYLKDGESPARAILSQFNADNSAGVDLRYQRAQNTWGMCWSYTTVEGRKCATVLGPDNAAIKNAWTHVAGVYDSSANKLILYINGRFAGERVLTAAEKPQTTGGPLVVGKSPFYAFNGLVDEVRVWNQAIDADFMLTRATYADRNPYGGNEDPSEATGGSLVSLVGSWDASIAGMADQSYFGRGTLQKSASGVSFDNQRGMVMDGASGSLTGAGPFLDETGSFTLSAIVDVDLADLIDKPAGHQARIMGQSAGPGQSSWALWFVKKSGVGEPVAGYWAVGRWEKPILAGAEPQVADEDAFSEQASVDQTTVNAVYDSINQKLTVFEGSDERGSITFTKPVQGSGSFYVGWGADSQAGRFDGAIQKVQLWAGAMDATQLSGIGQLTQLNEVVTP